jgi:spore germination protein YaaH
LYITGVFTKNNKNKKERSVNMYTKYTKKLVSLLVVFALVITAFGCNLTGNKSNNKTLPAPARRTKVKMKRPDVGGFYVNDPGGFDSMPSLKAHSNVLDELYPLWYHVKPDGSLREEPNEKAIAFAHSQKIKIFPLINVVPNKDTVLRNPAARDNAIGNIVRIVKAHNYDGVDIDFEFVPSTGQRDFRVDRQEMTLFIKLLSAKLTKLGKETHMAVLPLIGVSPEMSGVFDYSALSPFVNKVTVMCYDHSQEGSPPGPLAPFDWVEQNIKTSIKQGFKPSQICLGVATYGYDWPAGKSGGFTSPSKKILQEAVIKGHQVKWSDRHQEPYYIYTSPDGTKREVWFENSATLQTKINLVNKYKLSGVCIWRLGYEDPRFWNTLIKNWGTRK